MAGLLAWLIYTSGGAVDARRAEKYWQTVTRSEEHLASIDWQASPAQFADLLRNAQSASELQPLSAHYRHWLNVYRWQSMSRIKDEAGNIILPAQAMPHVRRLIDEFADAIRLCPTFGQSWAMSGQLAYFIYEPPHHTGAGHGDSLIQNSKFKIQNYRALGSDMIRTGYTLAPNDPTVCFVNGVLDVVGNNQSSIINHQSEPGFFYFARAIELNPQFFAEAAEIYLSRLNRPDLAVKLAGDNISRLNQLAQRLAESDDHSDLADQARRSVINILEINATDPQAPASTLASLARIYAADGRTDEAIALYHRALTADYGNIGWRLHYARLLGQAGQTEDAIHNARICLRLRPGYTPAQRLIEELSVQ